MLTRCNEQLRRNRIMLFRSSKERQRSEVKKTVSQRGFSPGGVCGTTSMSQVEDGHLAANSIEMSLEDHLMLD